MTVEARTEACGLWSSAARRGANGKGFKIKHKYKMNLREGGEER